MAAKRTHKDVADIIDSSSYETDNRSSTNVFKRKFSGSATYKVTFKNKWKESYPIKEVNNNKFKFHCIPCDKDLSCCHQGLIKDVKDNCSKPSHLQTHSSLKKQSRPLYHLLERTLPNSSRSWMQELWFQTLLCCITYLYLQLIISVNFLKIFFLIFK